jgi:hypothetical protein
LPLSSLLGGHAWIVYIVNHYRRAHSKISRVRTSTACITARQALADLAGMGTTACSQPQPHDEVGEIHAMRLAVSQRVLSSSLLHWPSPACERCRSCKPRHATNSQWRAITPSECASTAAPTSRSFTLHRVYAVPDTTSTEHPSIVYDGQDHRLERRCSCVPARGSKGPGDIFRWETTSSLTMPLLDA